MVDSSPAGRGPAAADPAATAPAATAPAAGLPASPPLPIAELEAQITELAGHLNAANHRWLVLIAEFDRREGWADGSTQSCAHWLSWKCGIDPGAAREKVRVARALEALPKISAAMAGGELSYSKVRALSRVATPATEDTLLMIALHGTAAHVETVVRHFRRAQESIALDREARQLATRGLHYHYDDDGALVLQARLPAEAGALLVRALDQATAGWHRERRERDVSAETWADGSAAHGSLAHGSGAHGSGAQSATTSAPTLGQRRADALAQFAESWLAHGDQALSGGDRQRIVVHVDAETLVGAASDGAADDGASNDRGKPDDDGTPRQAMPGRCELEDGPALAVETARRLACDASVVRIVEDGRGRPLDVGRKTRSIPPAIRRALQSRDAGCRFPGCTHTRFLDGHHIRHWANGGATRLSNLVLLCRHHHRQVHEGRVEVQVLDDGALRFKGPDGRALEAAPRTSGDSREIVLAHRRAGLAIDAGTAMTRWAGERMDYGMAIEGLLRQQERAQQERAGAGGSGPGVSAETRRASQGTLPTAGSSGWS